MQEWTWGEKSDEPPPYRGLNFKAREGQAAFQPPNDPDCPEWKTRPFFDFGDGKGFVRMRVRAPPACLCARRSTYFGLQNLLEPNGMRFNRAYELIEKRISTERDWLVRLSMRCACCYRALTPKSSPAERHVPESRAAHQRGREARARRAHGSWHALLPRYQHLRPL